VREPKKSKKKTNIGRKNPSVASWVSAHTIHVVGPKSNFACGVAFEG